VSLISLKNLKTAEFMGLFCGLNFLKILPCFGRNLSVFSRNLYAVKDKAVKFTYEEGDLILEENKYFLRMSSKGQITLIKPIRERLALNKGDFVIIEIRDNDEVIIKKGSLKLHLRPKKAVINFVLLPDLTNDN
jgi:bifunctional DNA-binding transcriptional regulator/antitoxin component of YhaV-PrlF toxin-antitoxin module